MPSSEATQRKILAACVARGCLTPAAAARVESLCRHDLHLEQALLGTGLVSVDDYGAALSEVTGLPFVRPESADVDFSKSSYEQLSDQRVCLLYSDWRRRQERPFNQIRRWPAALQAIIDEADRHQAWHLRLMDAGQKTLCAFDDGAWQESPVCPPGWLSVLPLRQQEIRKRWGWSLEKKSAGYGWLIALTRPASEHHPHVWDWLAAPMEFFTQPQGLLLVIHPDPFVRRALQQQAETLDDDQHWRGSSVRPHWLEAATPQQAEIACHLVMAGKPCVVCVPPEAAVADRVHSAWWSMPLEAGIPVRMIRGRRVSTGVAWESYQL